jgi:hypothetical protein
MHLPAYQVVVLASKMPVLIVTNEWHRVMILWSTTMTDHEDWTPSVPPVNAGLLLPLGVQFKWQQLQPVELKASLSSLHLVQHGWILCVSLTSQVP